MRSHTMLEIVLIVFVACDFQRLSAHDDASLALQRLHVEPHDVTVVSGETTSFACYATQRPVTLTWVKDSIYALAIDRFIVSPEQSRISVSVNETAGSYELHISNLQPGDAGTYHCELAANLPSEHVTSEPSRMTVIVPPTFHAQPQDFEGIEGQVAMFRCVADGYPKPLYKWFDTTENPIDPSKSKFGISPSGEYLTIYELSELDSGAYLCVASNQAGKIEGRANLSVVIPPGLNAGRTETREQGQEATFICSMMRGEGKLSWWKNGKHIEEGHSDDHRILVEPHSETGDLHLTISRIQKGDEGSWTCAAFGRKGKDTVTTTDHHLTIKVRPIILQPSTQLVTARVGEKMTMSCQNIRPGGGQPGWYDTRHGVVVTEYESKRLFVRVDPSSNASDLIVSEVASEDQGVFCCVTDGDMNCFMLLTFTK